MFVVCLLHPTVAKTKMNLTRSLKSFSCFINCRSCLHQHTQIWERMHVTCSTKATTSACGSWMWRQRPTAVLNSLAPDTRIRRVERSSDHWRPSTKLRNTGLPSPKSGTQTTHWHPKSPLRTNSSRDSNWASMDPSHHNPGKEIISSGGGG